MVENNGSASADRRYCYDAQNRLAYRNTGAACSSTAKDETYAYDAAGNRTSAPGFTFSYNANGQLTGCSPSCNTVAHDAAGRMSRWNGWWLAYDAEGRLREACKSSTCALTADRVDFAYDAEGRRSSISTRPGGGSTSTLELRYRGSSVVEEWTDGTLSRSYLVDEAGAIVKLTIPDGQSGAGTYLVTWNGHGDALGLWRINATGTLTLANSFSYSTWGAPTTATHNSIPDLGFRYLYVGQFGVQWDNQLGLSLHYMSARHYSPVLGRFIQSDPSGQEANHYAYASLNPIGRVDPCGLVSRPFHGSCGTGSFTAWRFGNGILAEFTLRPFSGRLNGVGYHVTYYNTANGRHLTIKAQQYMIAPIFAARLPPAILGPGTVRVTLVAVTVAFLPLPEACIVRTSLIVPDIWLRAL